MRQFKSRIIKYKKPLYDMALNVAANGIPIIVLQLVILPLLTKRMSEDNYGLLVTILAILNTIPASFGNVLNNIRILYDKKYIERKGDFSIILFMFEVISAIAVVICAIIISKEFELLSVSLLILISLLWLAKEYYIVAFRLVINYKAILITNIIVAIGYLTGYIIFLLCRYWQYIYILGNLFGLVYVLHKSKLHIEPFSHTNLFSFILKQSCLLLASGILLKLMTYADKFIIYPILGGSTVSIYYVSTLSGKIVSLLVAPVAGVMLTYLTRMKKNNKIFSQALSLGTIICLLGYLFGVLVSRPVLSAIYPTFVDRAMEYIYITTGTAVLSALYSLLNPFIINFFDMKWQIFVNAITVILYISLSLALLSVGGLVGFCFGTLITNLLRVVFVILIYFKSKSLNDTEIKSI